MRWTASGHDPLAWRLPADLGAVGVHILRPVGNALGPALKAINHQTQPKDEWRTGVLTRMCISELTGSKDLCVFEQWCDPGAGAPLHSHNVEEVLSVVSGEAEIRSGTKTAVLGASESVVIPAGVEHGYRNIGSGNLHMRAILSAGYFEAFASPSGEATVRWRSSSLR